MCRFEKAYIKYDDIKKAKLPPSESGAQIFKWEGYQFNHISVGTNQVDYLVFDGIVICSFPPKKDRNKIYEFMERHWKDTIEPFCKYIKDKHG